MASGPAELEMTMNQVTKTIEAFTKAARDAAELSRGNVEATAQATQAYLQGTQELGRQTFALAQGLNAQAIEGAKALAGAKSLKEAAEIQALVARAAFDRTASETAKLQQAILQVTERAFAPLMQRATTAVAQATAVTRPLAA
jgi:hypothetical protein